MPEVTLHEDYDLPLYNVVDSLVICISWSGNTEETISAYQKARELGLTTTVITSGGQLAELAKKNNNSLVLLINDGIQPRMAVGYMTGALFEILGLGEQLIGSHMCEPITLEDQGRKIAKQIGNKTPLIYTTAKYEALAYFWKILFNENCKIHAFSNYFPRMEHNELAGFNTKDKDKFFYIVLRDETEDPRQNRNLNSALAIMNQIGHNGVNVNLSGNTLLNKVFDNYVLGLWTSHYLAQELGVDPSDIKVIEDFKSLKRTS